MKKLKPLMNENSDLKAAENIFHHLAPHLIDEMRGLSGALNIPL